MRFCVCTWRMRTRALEASWNVMAHAQKPDFVFRWNERVHLNRRRASVQSTTGSRGVRVRINGINAGYTMFCGSVKGTGYPIHSPVSPSLPLPCVTVCHHISTGVYTSPSPRKCEFEVKPFNDGTVSWWFWYLATEWPLRYTSIGPDTGKPCIRLCELWPGDVRGTQNTIICVPCAFKCEICHFTAFCYWAGDIGDFARVFVPLLCNWKAVWRGITMASCLSPPPPLLNTTMRPLISFVCVSS